MKLRKHIFNIVAFVFAGLFCFSGCFNQNGSDNSSNSGNNSETNSSSYESSSQEPEISESGTNIIEKGRSDYKVVIPAAAEQMETYAAQELVGFLQQASGVRLAVVTDDQVEEDFSGKYISVGDTALFKMSGLEIDRATYTLDGYRIVTEDNTVILKGNSGYGTLYAVYGFLQYTIGFHAYSTDELYFETKNEVPLLEFDVSEIPDFEGRTTNYSLVFERTQGQVAARMNMYAGWQGGYTIYDGRVWPLWIHSARVLVPYSLYPELYEASGGTQVCVTSEKAVATWLENLKKVIEENPGGINFGIGLEDSASHCTCITCKTEAAEHGGYGGVMMRFLNKLSDMLDPWMQEVFPGREIRLVGLAYHAWLEAPIKEDANGNIVPYDDTVLPRENVGVMYAPDSACYGCAMNDPNCSTNVAFARHLNNWSVVCDKLTVYSYCTNFYNYFINFNNWGAMQENYRFFKECGVYYVYDQGAPETYNPMQALRVYLTSRLLWDVEQNVDDLIDDFMAHYYKAGAQYIRKYYDLTRAHYARLAEDGIWTNINIGVVGDRVSSKEWPYAYCTQAMKCFDDAKKAVQESNLDTETKEKVLLRIDRDSTAVRYLILQNYSDKYSKTDWNAMVEEFSSICTLGNIRICAEWGTPVSDLINQWRKL